MGAKITYVVILLGIWAHAADAVTREYFVGIEEIEWDYAPSGQNLMKSISLEKDEDASVFTRRGGRTVGKVYKKAVYREYTDSTFTIKSPREEQWGIIGPPIKAEVGDKLTVHVKNVAAHHFSMHPHGVFYNKTDEGALYRDKTSAGKKLDDGIEPGTTYTYHWDVIPSFAPAVDDPSCLTWAYHSHTNAPKDTNSGLFGPIIICRTGTLDSFGNREDVDEEFYFLFTVLDENESWYLDENIQAYCTDPGVVDPDDEDFQESNKMHGINGLMYGNLQGIDACRGSRIAVYLLGLGTEVDLHSVHFHGQTIISHHHRQDTVNIFPGVFETVFMTADNPGTFDLSCSVNDHISAGMTTTFTVTECREDNLADNNDLTGTVRDFFIGIVEEDWSYAPSGRNIITDKNLTLSDSDSEAFFERGRDRIGGVYKKAIFHEFQSEAFEIKKAKPDSFGILGPLIAVEVGDEARVTLKNFATNQAYNVEPHGVFYDDLTPVEAGDTRTYTWKIPDSVSPTDADDDCVAYIYTSSADPVADTNSGLVGPLLVCKRGTLEDNLHRRAVYLLFTVFDENSSHYIEDNIQRFTADPESVDAEDGDFMESNLMHSINGLMYGNLDVEFCLHAQTDIHVLAIGTEVDMHSFYLQGLTYTFRNEYTNVLNVFPHTTASTTITPIELGQGQLTCQVYDHLLGGMKTKYSVVDCGSEPEFSHATSTVGVTRTYYIAAVEEVWNYFPWKGQVMDHDLSAFTGREKGKFIGSKYWKAIYHEYTDNTFTMRKKKPIHLGLLGPILSAEEGDNIEVVFRNMASRPYSVFPWGLSPEGFFEDGIIAAYPGETVTYTWEIPSEAVPTKSQPLCNAHTYVSNAGGMKDVYTGLVGPLLICRKGGLTEDGRMRGADNEFFLTFIVMDESSSHYLDKNIREFAESDPNEFDKEGEDFLENNLMHGINGRLDFLEGLEMFVGDRVIWHLQGIGNEVDIHTIHFHAHAYLHISDIATHGDVFNLFPGKVGTVDMTVNAVGEWLLHCHVNDHVAGGMTTTYTVLPNSAKTSRRHLCYSWRKGPRKNDLHCAFESPFEATDFTQQAAGGFGVCLSKSKSNGVYRCQDETILQPEHVNKLTISTNFNLDPESFRDLLAMFTELSTLTAENLGLEYLNPDTFLSNPHLQRIDLSRNKLQDVPPGLFSFMEQLRHVNLHHNLLQWNWTEPLSKRFRGVKGKVVLRHNPGLKDHQKIYRFNRRAT